MFVGVLIHDRPELLEKCLRSIPRAGMPYRLGFHLDAPDEETLNVARKFAANATVYSTRRVGVAGAQNALLDYREASEPVCFVDSDVEFRSDGWLRTLDTALLDWDCVAPVCTKIPHPNGINRFASNYHPVEIPATGVRMYAPQVIEKLGGFYEGYSYAGLAPNDYHERMKRAGFSCAYVSEAVVELLAEERKRFPPEDFQIMRRRAKDDIWLPL